MGPEKTRKSAWGLDPDDKLGSPTAPPGPPSSLPRKEESSISHAFALTLREEEANRQPMSPVKPAFQQQRPTPAAPPSAAAPSASEHPVKAAAIDTTKQAVSSPKKEPPKQKRTAVFRDPTVLMHCHPEGDMRPVEVTVFEASEPSATNYALKFEVKRGAGSPVVEGRLDFHSLFEMVTAWSQGEMPKEYRLTGGVKGKAIDAAMRKWIVSGTPPERVLLVRWVLWRTLLVLRDEVGGMTELVFVGAEVPLDDDEDDDGEVPAYLPPPGSEYDETPPPSYFSGDPDELPPPPYADAFSLTTTELGPPPPYEDSMTIQLPDMTGEEGFKEWDRDLLVSYQRPDAVRTADKSAWDQYRWRLTMELKKSHRDLEEMREMRRRQKAVRRAREVELLTKMNVLRHKQKTDTIQRRKTKQMVCDVLDLHEMMETMKMEQKRLSCQIMKDREKIITVKQPFCMRRGRHQPGAHLGDGPIPYPATTRPSDNAENRAALRYHWDVHGRRHKRDGPPPPGSFYEEAMKVIVKLSGSGFERHLCLHRAFKHFDRDGNRKVTLSEFATALQVLKPKPTTEQLVTLFRHFDPNGTGAVNYGEFLTQFFSRRKFLKAMAVTEQAETFILDKHGGGKAAAAEAHKSASVATGKPMSRSERPGSSGSSRPASATGGRRRAGEVLRSVSADHLIVSQVESLQAYMETMNKELEELILRRKQQQHAGRK